MSGLKTKTTAEEQSLNIMPLSNRETKDPPVLTQDLRDTSGHSLDPSTVH